MVRPIGSSYWVTQSQRDTPKSVLRAEEKAMQTQFGDGDTLGILQMTLHQPCFPDLYPHLGMRREKTRAGIGFFRSAPSEEKGPGNNIKITRTPPHHFRAEKRIEQFSAHPQKPYLRA